MERRNAHAAAPVFQPAARTTPVWPGFRRADADRRRAALADSAGCSASAGNAAGRRPRRLRCLALTLGASSPGSPVALIPLRSARDFYAAGAAAPSDRGMPSDAGNGRRIRAHLLRSTKCGDAAAFETK
ncbi:MAG: hypothetical protein ACLRMJ_05805 [Alistipes finegoldii]